MLTHAEASITLKHMTSILQAQLYTYGISPSMVFMLTKGRGIESTISHPLMAETVHTRFQNLKVLEDFEGEDEETIHNLLIVINSIEPDNREERNALTAELAERHKPDAIGYVACSLYRSFPEGKGPHHLTLLSDPEAIKAIVGSYYLIGDETPRTMIAPYILRHEKYQPDPDDPQQYHDVTIADSGWYWPIGDIPPQLSYPY